jgi:hypothetical protein
MSFIYTNGIRIVEEGREYQWRKLNYDNQMNMI